MMRKGIDTYNTLMVNFYEYFATSVDHNTGKQYQRVGQAFYNLYHDLIFDDKPHDKLFYCEDNDVAYDMIHEILTNYVKNL